MLTTRNGEVEIAYELVDDAGPNPMLLLSGSFMQMIHWPDQFLKGLVARGFAVARFDNRDTGRSTHCADLPPYTLRDLADDAVAVLDALGWSSAHVLGPSLGGMIGQAMAVHHPDRVRSLTSISAAPGWGVRISRPRLWNGLRMVLVARKHGRDRDEVVEQTVRLFRLMGTILTPADERWVRDVTARAYDISDEPSGGMRQLAALKASGDRTAELSRVRVPTLVVHGDKDPMQSVHAGRATAAAIPGARLRILPGVGHYVPLAMWPQIIDELCDLLEHHPRS